MNNDWYEIIVHSHVLISRVVPGTWY